MRTIIILGYKEVKNSTPKSELIYVGPDGSDAVAASDKARESGIYIRIRRGDDTGFHPVAHVPFPKPVVPNQEAPKNDSQPQTTKE